MPIPINSYIDPAIFDKELEEIFLRQMFVTHQNDIIKNEDYFSFRLGKRSYTLRNFGENNNLLDNVCRHRFNLIDPPGFGNRRFRCGYHGWTYNSDGAATFIPLRETFANLPEEIRLPQVPYENVQGFQFLMQPDAVRRNEISDMIDRIGAPHGELFFRGEIRHNCNWKLIVENVLEAYHLSFVHATSFSSPGFKSTGHIDILDIGNRFDTLGVLYPDEAGAKQILRIVPNIEPSYRHLHIFPNMFVSLGNELVYYIATLMPVSVDETVLHYSLYPTQKLMALTPSLRDHFMKNAIDLTARTLEEDRVMLESNQIGLLSVTGEYNLCWQERRMNLFHDAYQRLM